MHLLARWLWDYEIFERVLRDLAAEGVTGLRDLICLEINEVPHIAGPFMPLTFAFVYFCLLYQGAWQRAVATRSQEFHG